jgi:hypothetical protein
MFSEAETSLHRMELSVGAGGTVTRKAESKAYLAKLGLRLT